MRIGGQCHGERFGGRGRVHRRSYERSCASECEWIDDNGEAVRCAWPTRDAQMQLANALCGYAETAQAVEPALWTRLGSLLPCSSLSFWRFPGIRISVPSTSLL